MIMRLTLKRSYIFYQFIVGKYQSKEAWVVNLSLDAEIKIGQTAVKFLPYWKLLV